MKKVTVFSLMISLCLLISIGMLVLQAMGVSSEKNLKAEKHFEQAAEFIRKWMYEDAISELEQVITLVPKSKMAQDAQYWIGQSYFRSEQYDHALSQFENLLKEYPQSAIVPVTQLMIGRVKEAKNIQEIREAATEILDSGLVNEPETGIQFRKIHSLIGKSDLIPASTWLTLSPNGKFLLKGKLVVPVDGSDPFNLVDMPANAGSWSSDGKKVAFYSGGSIWVIPVSEETARPSGPAKKLLDGNYWNQENVRWSPDSKKIVFSRRDKEIRDDIWIMSVMDGRLMQVTSDSASEGYAIWSPDGKTIAYLKDRVSWLIPVSGGKPQKISSNFYHPLAFSSDSQWLIGNPRSGRELWFYNTTDAREFKMTLPKSIGNFLSISPNGRSLLFYNSSFEYKMALKIVSASGGPSLELGKNLSLYPFYQYWSADSKMIVSRGEKSGDVWDLWILPISNDKPFPLELNISIEKPIEPYSLSPDRKMLLFSVPQSDKLENLWVVPISLGEGRNTGPASKIFSGFEKRRMGSIYDADWSPDGKKLAICNKGDIWITSIQAEDPIKLTTITEQIYSPSWSPDGKWIAYLVSLGNKINIKIISTSDGRVNTVLENFIGTAYGWSPDGKELAFGSEGFIESYSVDNSTIRKIADLKNLPMAKAYNLCWSPDGEMLAFTDWRKAVHASSPIFTVPSKGGEIIELTTYDTDYWNWKGYVFWSPDGKWISYNHDGFVKIRPEGSIWEADFAEILDKLSK